MNAKDKARLHELKLRVWAAVAKKLRAEKTHRIDPDCEPLDAFVIRAPQIESHKGRFPKALKLLESEGYVTPFGKYKAKRCSEVDVYRVLRFEESVEYGVKPTMVENIEFINQGLNFACFAENMAGIGYTCDFKDTSEIYLWWHLDEYDCSPQSLFVYEKAKLDLLRKRVLRTLVERRVKEDFPGYIQAIVPGVTAVAFETTSFSFPNPISFKDLNEAKLEENLKEYEIELERMIRYLSDLNAILDVISGRFEFFMGKIRRMVIHDFLNGFERFPQGFKSRGRNPLAPGEKDIAHSACPNRSNSIFRFFDKFRDLCSYETLYLDPEVGSTEVKDLSLLQNLWSEGIGSLNYEEEFMPNEKENTRAA